MERITLLLFQAQAGVFLFSFRFDAENLRCLCLTFFYYINTSEIPGELSRENFISSRDHCLYGYIINNVFESKPIWYFTGVYIINRIVKYKRHVLVESSCWPLEDKIHIHARACNILCTSLQHAKVYSEKNLSHGYILNICWEFLKFQPQYSCKVLISLKKNKQSV